MKQDEVTIGFEERFSESILWKLQKTAYAEFGITAWSEKGVPFYLTSHALTAHKYASLAIAYIQDCLSENAKTPIDLAQKLYFFDLGAGSGRFAFLFLKQFFAGLNLLGLEKLKICYVMTDIVKTNIDFWRSHPLLQEWIQAGQLDFAFFEHNQKNSLELLVSNTKLIECNNPAILIANYFFDTVPQDYFRCEEGRLYEGLLTLKVPASRVKGDPKVIDPAWIPSLTCYYTYEHKNASCYYPNTLCNSILEEYCKAFNASFLFPSGSIEAIDYFSKLTNQRLLLLGCDQGFSSPEQIKGYEEPHLAKHGSFSMSVSYHALGRYFTLLGGTAFLTQQSDTRFAVITAVLGGNKNSFKLTHYSFVNNMEAFEPFDYWKISDLKEHKISFETLMSLLKLGYWDPPTFNEFYLNLTEQIPNLTKPQSDELAKSIDLVWENFYPVGPLEGDFVMNLGVLLFLMNRFKDALKYFQRAQKISGGNELLARNIAACEARIVEI
jgi:hypothetical protein